MTATVATKKKATITPSPKKVNIDMLHAFPKKEHKYAYGTSYVQYMKTQGLQVVGDDVTFVPPLQNPQSDVKTKTLTKRKTIKPVTFTIVHDKPSRKKTVATRKSSCTVYRNPTKRKATKKKRSVSFSDFDEYVLLRNFIHSASSLYSASRNIPPMACKLRRRSNELKKLKEDTKRKIDNIFNM